MPQLSYAANIRKNGALFDPVRPLSQGPEAWFRFLASTSDMLLAGSETQNAERHGRDGLDDRFANRTNIRKQSKR